MKFLCEGSLVDASREIVGKRVDPFAFHLTPDPKRPLLGRMDLAILKAPFRLVRSTLGLTARIVVCGAVLAATCGIVARVFQLHAPALTQWWKGLFG